MKSAYELVMNRLEKGSPMAKISEKQRNALAQIDSEFSAKIAERKLFLEGLMRKAVNNPTEAHELRVQLASEITRLESEREAKKETIRRGETTS